ncbi:hypothetical protein ABVK25_007450 [Lepraria finkii]|uniref:Uncharacterized protein n=1 Tax=Lepraria finkii TaxID=1340010 RepID=A0ABR4B5W3_9LECA
MFLWKRKPKPDLSFSVKIHVALSREQPFEITLHYDKKVGLDNVNFMTGTNDIYTIKEKHLCSQSEFFDYCFLASTPPSQMENVIRSCALTEGCRYGKSCPSVASFQVKE